MEIRKPGHFSTGHEMNICEINLKSEPSAQEQMSFEVFFFFYF